jgi:hypothetical protein
MKQSHKIKLETKMPTGHGWTSAMPRACGRVGFLQAIVSLARRWEMLGISLFVLECESVGTFPRFKFWESGIVMSCLGPFNSSMVRFIIALTLSHTLVLDDFGYPRAALGAGRETLSYGNQQSTT